jgi:hypothetical protein
MTGHGGAERGAKADKRLQLGWLSFLGICLLLIFGAAAAAIQLEAMNAPDWSDLVVIAAALLGLLLILWAIGFRFRHKNERDPFDRSLLTKFRHAMRARQRMGRALTWSRTSKSACSLLQQAVFDKIGELPCLRASSDGWTWLAAADGTGWGDPIVILGFNECDELCATALPLRWPKRWQTPMDWRW